MGTGNRPDGAIAEAWLQTGDSYVFTPAASIRAVEETLGGIASRSTQPRRGVRRRLRLHDPGDIHDRHGALQAWPRAPLRTLPSEGGHGGKTRAYDVVVVGGGAAGLSAALVLGRARRRVAVVDAGAPRNAPAAHMQGFLSRDGMPPAELLAAGRAEVTGYGVELLDDQVVGIEPGFVVRLAGGEY